MSKTRNLVVGGAAGLVVLVGLFWLSLPPPPIPQARERIPVEMIDIPTVGVSASPKEFTSFPIMREEDIPEEPTFLPLEEDPAIRVVTGKCKMLVEQQRNRVPQSSLLDTIRDRSLTFDDDDIQCMTAGGATPAVLDLAEMRIDHNKRLGIVGKPGRNLSKDPLRQPGWIYEKPKK